MDLHKINFWKRLELFVGDIQVNDVMSQEEKEMILRIAQIESLRPTDEDISAKVEEYGFRVPYDGSNKFYDDDAIKHFRAGAEWARGFACVGSV